MPEGADLTLSAEAVDEMGVPGPAGHLAAGRHVRIRVADTGSGMTAATVARLAEPFFTTKPQGRGTGLGLAMVKGFAEQSGGAMVVTTKLGAGTTIDVWLGQAMDDASLNRIEETAHRPIRTGAARIMVVDDDDLVRETLAEQLEDLGFKTIMASSGSEAVALIQSGVSLDALVSDLSMPGMSGVATIQRVRTLRPGLPCFLLTGYVGERAALEAGARSRWCASRFRAGSWRRGSRRGLGPRCVRRSRRMTALALRLLRRTMTCGDSQPFMQRAYRLEDML